jgi:hypothetical protein
VAEPGHRTSTGLPKLLPIPDQACQAALLVFNLAARIMMTALLAAMFCRCTQGGQPGCSYVVASTTPCLAPGQASWTGALDASSTPESRLRPVGIINSGIALLSETESRRLSLIHLHCMLKVRK